MRYPFWKAVGEERFFNNYFTLFQDWSYVLVKWGKDRFENYFIWL
jgi:hypothetical protein